MGLPLTDNMFTKEDLLLFNEKRNTILHMDATGSVVRRPESLKCKKIFYYSIVAKHDYEVIELLRMYMK